MLEQLDQKLKQEDAKTAKLNKIKEMKLLLKEKQQQNEQLKDEISKM